MTMVRRLMQVGVCLLLPVALSLGVAPPAAQSSPARSAGQPRIDGSYQSPKGSWPSQAALLRRGVRDGRDAYFCGATVVSPNWVLTSARCLLDGWGNAIPVASVDVLVGTQNLRKGGRRINAAKFMVHPRFDRRTLDYDVALIRLAKPTAAKPQVLSAVPVAPNAKVTMVGFGHAWLPVPTPATLVSLWTVELRQGSFWIGTDIYCRKWLRTYRGATMQCIHGGPYLDMGDDDRGDPILAYRSGSWVQVGIASWKGLGFGDNTRVSVVAKLSVAVPWIRQVIRG